MHRQFLRLSRVFECIKTVCNSRTTKETVLKAIASTIENHVLKSNWYVRIRVLKGARVQAQPFVVYMSPQGSGYGPGIFLRD